jgi:hypothetical protein
MEYLIKLKAFGFDFLRIFGDASSTFSTATTSMPAIDVKPFAASFGSTALGGSGEAFVDLPRKRGEFRR